MDTNPEFFKGLHERFLCLVGNETSSMPSCASVQHVKDDVLLHEKQVTFNLSIESVGHVSAANVVGSGFAPLSTYPARLHCLRDEFKHLVVDSDTFQESPHGL